MNYEKEWDFYFSNVDDKPGSFYLDELTTWDTVTWTTMYSCYGS